MDTTTLTAHQHGLTSSEVAQRRAAGQVNTVERATSRTRANIVKTNIATRFNALVVALAAVIVVFGELIDLTFAMVMVLNAGIGIVQELRAKKTLDNLSVLVASTVDVVRDGSRRSVAIEEIVLGDLVCLKVGDQVPVDGTIAESNGFEADESSLTGESDPVPKNEGDEVRSGSAVVAGMASIVATRVGGDSWISQLEKQAREFDPARSELRHGIDQILRLIGWILPPLGALLVWSQLRSGSSVDAGLVAAVAGVVALIPQGLVLLVSITMATAVVRLARKSVVVRELPAVEGLARVDVICLDKTGTLTTGRLALVGIEAFDGATLDSDGSDPDGSDSDGSDSDGSDPSTRELFSGLAALAANEANPTAMFGLIAAEVGSPPSWVVTAGSAFSSARKWSGASFSGGGTWVIGAPEIILDAMAPDRTVTPRQRIHELTAMARRVLLVARTPVELQPSGELPTGLVPVGIVILNEEIRPDAKATMRYFLDQQVTVKIISGDNPVTVSAVARELGIPGAESHIDMRHFQGSFTEIAESTTVFGRVQPEQKRELVRALQQAGHTVAMTGDGVNDIPALKAADIAIAMDTATPATKAVSELVLLNGRFDLLPSVVAEGRRVVANMERVSSLFLTKTVYATVFALAAGLSRRTYPFLPRHLSLIADLTVGIPAFVVGFRPSLDRCRPGYLRRVARFAVPAGAAAAAVTLAVFWLLRSDVVNASLEEARTGATISLGVCGFWIFYRLVRPLDRGVAALLVGLASVFAAMFAIGPLADLYELHIPSSRGVSLLALLVIGTLGVLEAVLRGIERRTVVAR